MDFVSPSETSPKVTAVASLIINAAPPTARLPKCTRCQSFANPSGSEYWHMGEISLRLLNVISYIVRGEKSIHN